MQLVPHHGVVGWMAPHFYPPNHRSHPVERIFSLHRRFLVQTLSFFSILLLILFYGAKKRFLCRLLPEPLLLLSYLPPPFLKYIFTQTHMTAPCVGWLHPCLLLCGLLPLPTPTQRMFLPDLFLPPLTLLFLLFLSLSFSFFHLMFHGQSGLV
eukprot:RCo004421